MTHGPDRPLSAEQERRVRAALASARATSAPPEDVAARLDATLLGLVAEREAAQTGVQTTAPTGGRRGRWLLLAGAAVVAALVALGVPALHPDQAQTPTAEGSSSAATQSPNQPQSQSHSQSPNQSPNQFLGTAVPTPGLARLHGRSFRSDVKLLLGSADRRDLAAAPATRLPGPATGSDNGSITGRRTASCPGGAAPAGVTRQEQVLLDGQPALLDVFPVRGGSRLVRAVSCDGVETLASTRIPARGKE